MNFKRYSHFISALLHPFLMPTFIYYLVMGVYFKPLFQFQDYGLLSFLGLILVATCLLPACSIYILYRYGIISDFNLIIRTDRLIPNIATTTTYLLTFVMFKYINHLSNIVVLPILYISITLVFHTLISLFWKISAHATGAAGALGFWVAAHYFIPQEKWFYPLLVFVILVGSLLSARMYLGRHTAAQVWAGFGLGFIIACLGLVDYFY